MVAPAGAPASRLKVNDCPGRSGLVAVAVNIRRLPSLTDLFPIGAKTGGWLPNATDWLFENSDVLPTGSVAVAVTKEPTATKGTVAVKVALPLPSVVTSADPR